MHTVSEIRALQTENIEKGSEDRHTEKLDPVLYPRKTGEISTPRIQTWLRRARRMFEYRTTVTVMMFTDLPKGLKDEMVPGRSMRISRESCNLLSSTDS